MIKWFKNVALFLAAPFIGLAYIIALPVYGTVMLGKTSIEAFQKKGIVTELAEGT